MWGTEVLIDPMLFRMYKVMPLASIRKWVKPL